MKRKSEEDVASGACDVCGSEAATVVCEEDHARLCGGCDAQVLLLLLANLG
jgi:hypothetical protein